MVTKNKMVLLMGEHEAIMAQMKCMSDSLSSVVQQSDWRTTRLVEVKVQLWSCRLGLYDLRDGIRRHIERDEGIFAVLGGASFEELTRQHKEICKEVDAAISLADATLAKELTAEEWKEYALNIGAAVNRICELKKAHTVTEDGLLETPNLSGQPFT